MPTAEKQKTKTPILTLTKPPTPSARVTPWIYSAATIVPEMALQYGFLPIERVLNQITLEKQDEKLASELTGRVGALFPLQEKIALLRRHFARNPGASPLTVFSEKFIGRGEHAEAEYHLDIIGTAQTTAEALLIKLCFEIARESAEKNAQKAFLEINSVGERESFSRFSRDMTAHFQKHLGDLHADCRQGFKKSHFVPVTCAHSECDAVCQTMPESIGYLSEPSRHHFMHVLEHIEAAMVPYVFNKKLLIEPDFVQHTVFSVFTNQEQSESNPTTVPATPPTIIARGSRWGVLARRMGFKKDVLGASAIVRVSIPKGGRDLKERKYAPPIFYLIHIGYDALLKSLSIIESLRRAKIAVYHDLLKDKITAQLSNAEYLGVPYVLIMGQKESVEETILVRKMSTRSQETVPLTHLAQYLKNILRK